MQACLTIKVRTAQATVGRTIDATAVTCGRGGFGGFARQWCSARQRARCWTGLGGDAEFRKKAMPSSMLGGGQSKKFHFDVNAK